MKRPRASRSRFVTSRAARALVTMLGIAGTMSAASAASPLPEIRTSAANAVPRCVTPDRLMAFLKRRNGSLNPRFRDIATYYKRHGEAWKVRWDYAFFQMAIETNFLTYRAPNGRMGDVDPKQNNFAGIGTTGGGVPGDSFPDVSTGVLGQIQHLVVYSGEEIANPVAPRTQLKQVHILERSRELNRPVRFSDLARRWAADPKYGSSIAWVAQQYGREECQGRWQVAAQQAEVLPWQQPQGRAPAAAARVETAPARKDGSPVRTIWKRDGGKQVGAPSSAKAAPPATGEAKAVAAPGVEALPSKMKPAAPKVIATEAIPVAETSASSDPALVPEAPFALFAPPAGFAEVANERSGAQPRISPAVARAQTAAPLAIASVDPAPVAAQAPDAKPLMGPPPPLADSPAAPPAEQQAQATPDTSNFLPPSGLGVKPGRCVVETATFGGATTVLVKAPVGADVHYIALSVIDGFEQPMTQSFLATRPGGEAIGTYLNKDEALAKARGLCPDG